LLKRKKRVLCRATWMRFPPSGDLSDRFLIVNYLGNRVRDWPAETQLDI
jgi:hypothetical protein